MMLDDGDFPFSDGFLDVQCDTVVFEFVAFRFSTHMVDFGIQKVPLTWFQFTDGPVAAAGIVFGNELS